MTTAPQVLMVYILINRLIFERYFDKLFVGFMVNWRKKLAGNILMEC